MALNPGLSQEMSPSCRPRSTRCPTRPARDDVEGRRRAQRARPPHHHRRQRQRPDPHDLERSGHRGRPALTMVALPLKLQTVAESHQPIVDAIASGDAELAGRVSRDHDLLRGGPRGGGARRRRRGPRRRRGRLARVRLARRARHGPVGQPPFMRRQSPSGLASRSSAGSVRLLLDRQHTGRMKRRVEVEADPRVVWRRPWPVRAAVLHRPGHGEYAVGQALNTVAARAASAPRSARRRAPGPAPARRTRPPRPPVEGRARPRGGPPAS